MWIKTHLGDTKELKEEVAMIVYIIELLVWFRGYFLIVRITNLGWKQFY